MSVASCNNVRFTDSQIAGRKEGGRTGAWCLVSSSPRGCFEDQKLSRHNTSSTPESFRLPWSSRAKATPNAWAEKVRQGRGEGQKSETKNILGPRAPLCMSETPKLFRKNETS